ncbi:NADP-dependent oxidoreductase [Bailinhaonella thermotolerans]|uniref:NADP-dependent oxidoreductase n=1 Tax=Bailinhaonella thermotolerans TaxID=1070861 RepID=A0A3A4B9D6_9ACTN|nr:NADP-dependent oxidoreductase [Bailinhaonella thermotolerans]RJL30778.1 NADP-dependent oxidoreductase [Bailinhaonella thermotolerans]
MSKAIGFYEPGGPEVLQVIELPEAEAGPGQVRIAVRAAGVQPYDVAVVEGWLPAGVDPAFPRVPGNEFAGVIDQVGEGVTGFAPGDEVLGFGQVEAYREQLVIAADQVTAKPAAMPWAVAGGFSAAAQTAHIALREIGVGEGDTLLVHGAAGAVGTIAVRLARHWGARVIGVAREPGHEYLRSLGAVPVAYGEGFADRVRELAPEGVTAALDGVGGHALDLSLELVKDPGRVLTLVEHAKAAGLGVKVTPPGRSAARLAELADLYAQGVLTLETRTFPLERAADAHRAYRAGGNHGKIVLTVGDAR